MKEEETDSKLVKVPGGPEGGGRPVSVTAYADKKSKKYPVKKLILALAVAATLIILFIFKQ